MMIMLITSKLVIQILVLILANDNADNTNDNNANYNNANDNIANDNSSNNNVK